MTIKAEATVDGTCHNCSSEVRWYLTDRGVRSTPHPCDMGNTEEDIDFDDDLARADAALLWHLAQIGNAAAAVTVADQHEVVIPGIETFLDGNTVHVKTLRIGES